MKKLICSIAILVMAGTANVFGQNKEYIDAVGELLNACSSQFLYEKEQMTTELVDILKSNGVEEYATTPIINKYLENQFFEDYKQTWADIYYKEGISLEEINILRDALKEEKINVAIEKSTEMQKNMSEIAQSYLMENISYLMAGKEIPAPELSETVSTIYLDLIKKYNDASNTKQYLKEVGDNLTNLTANNIEDENQKQQMTSMMSKMFNGLVNNIDILMANAAIGVLTMEDLKIMNEFNMSESGKINQKIKAATTKNVIELGVTTINKFQNWYDANK